MDYRVVSVLGEELISLAEAKSYIRITNTQDDLLVSNMISQAHSMAEAYLSKDVQSKQREVYIPFVDREFYLPFSPIDQSVALVVEVEGQTLADDDYSTFGYENPSIRLERGSRDVKVTYTTKGLDAEVKQGLLAATAFLYKGGGRMDSEGTAPGTRYVSTDYKSFLAPYRRLYI